MPSIDNPTHYERAKYIAQGRADDFLKSLTPDDAEAETGSTESPVGHVMLINIDREMVRNWVRSDGDPWMSEGRNFDLGWYVVRTDDNGLIWGMWYGGEGVFAEENARADYAEADAANSQWLDQSVFTELSERFKGETLRHWYDFYANDPTRAYCGSTEGLVRLSSTNVNCQDCMAKMTATDRTTHVWTTAHWPTPETDDRYDEVLEAAVQLLVAVGYTIDEDLDEAGDTIGDQLQSDLMDAMFRSEKLQQALTMFGSWALTHDYNSLES